MKNLIYGIIVILLVACGSNDSVISSSPKAQPVPADAYIAAAARANITVQSNGEIRGLVSQATSNVSVSITNNASNIMTLNNFTPNSVGSQTSSTSDVDLGNISLATLFTNDLNHCGTGSNQHCGTAGIAAYTLTNAGLINGSDSSQIMPVLMSGPATSLTALTTATTGLTLQSITVASNKHTVSLSDFSPSPSFDTQVNFSNVGAGNYSGTVVIMFYIAP